LLAQEKVTKENAPQSIAPFGHPAQSVRVSGRVRLTAHPCAGSRMSAINRAHPAGFSDRCRRNAMGTRKSQGSALLRAEARAGAKQKHCTPLLLTWPSIFLPLHRTEHRRRRRGKGAHVRAQGCASSRRPAGAEKRRAPRARSARGAVSGAAFLW
jgi:hypothetical protein